MAPFYYPREGSVCVCVCACVCVCVCVCMCVHVCVCFYLSPVHSIVLSRDYQPIVRHEDFRLFACMNPATDVGKKTLPGSIRNRYPSSCEVY